MPFFGEEDFDEVGEDGQFNERWPGGQRGHGGALERRGGILAAGNEEVANRPLGHIRQGKVLQSPTEVTAGIPELEAPGQNYGECGSRDSAEVTQAGYSASKWPT